MYVNVYVYMHTKLYMTVDFANMVWAKSITKQAYVCIYVQIYIHAVCVYIYIYTCVCVQKRN